MIDRQFGLKTTFAERNIVESASSRSVTVSQTSQVLFSSLDDDLDEALRRLLSGQRSNFITTLGLGGR